MMNSLPSDLQKPKAIVFDLDGTLAVAHNYVFMQLCSFLKSKGHDLPDNIVDAYEASKKERGFRNYGDLLCPGEDAMAVIFFKSNGGFKKWLKERKIKLDDNLYTHIPENLVGAYVPLEPESTFNLLNAAKKNGVRLAIVTDASNIFRKAVETLFPQIEVMIFREDAQRKPHPEPIQKALEKLDLAAGPDVWVVGDAEGDLHAANFAGCQPVGFELRGNFVSEGGWYLRSVKSDADIYNITNYPEPMMPFTVRNMAELYDIYQQIAVVAEAGRSKRPTGSARKLGIGLKRNDRI